MEPSTSASEHPPPQKKKRRKLNSLPADIENENFKSLKISVEGGAGVKYVGNLHWKKNGKITRDLFFQMR
jgi:hypothetical protein